MWEQNTSNFGEPMDHQFGPGRFRVLASAMATALIEIGQVFCQVEVGSVGFRQFLAIVPFEDEKVGAIWEVCDIM